MNKLFATLVVALALGACSKSTDAPETAAVEIAYFFSGLELVG